MSDTVRILGFESGITAAHVIKPTHTTNTTPVVAPSASTGFDLTTIGRHALLLVISTAVTSNGVTYSVTESATTNGTYTAATTSGSLAKVTADGVLAVSVKRNPAKPFIRVTATGDNASTDVEWAAILLAL
jgi:hypothetical protein